MVDTCAIVNVLSYAILFKPYNYELRFNISTLITLFTYTVFVVQEFHVKTPTVLVPIPPYSQTNRCRYRMLYKLQRK